MRSDVIPGAVFPDYELTDHTGKRRKLSDLQGQHPMILVLSRGGFCPKDRRRPDWDIGTPELKAAWQEGSFLSLREELRANHRRTGLGPVNRGDHLPFLQARPSILA
jgi:hypothetical protein